MKKVVLGALFGVWTVIAAVGAGDLADRVFAQQSAGELPTGGSGELIAMPGPADEKGQLFIVVDPRSRAISVYHVDGATGKIALKSVRNIHWDLQITSLNNESPLPQQIRSMWQQNQNQNR